MTGPAMARRTATRPAPWAFAAPWGARGYVTDLDGPVHWVEFGEGPGSGPDRDEPPIVFVHGLGGSHLNWCLIGPQLAANRRVVALDLHGFGLTPGGRYTSTVQRNTRLLDRFVREVTGTPVILAGNSMGGLISILQTAAAPDTVQGLVLIDPALPLPRRAPDRQVGSQFLLYALPGLGELYVRTVMARTPPQLAVQRVVDLCFADPSRADPAMLTASIALAAERQSQPDASQGPGLPGRVPVADAGGWPAAAVLGDDGLGAGSGPAHRRRGRPAGAGGQPCARRPPAIRAGRRLSCPESGTRRSWRSRTS